MNSTDLKQIDSLLKKRLKNFVRKNDLKDFATKDDLKNFATKDDLKSLVTKDYLLKVLSNYPTKKDLKKELDDLAVEITLSADQHKAEKGKVEDLEKRVDRIEEELQISSI